MSDLIKREEAIKALRCEYPTMPMFKGLREEWAIKTEGFRKAEEVIMSVPSADRPQGEVDAVEIYERAEHNLEQGYITIGEFDKRIEPLRHLCYGRPQGEWKGYNADKGGDWLRDDGTPVFLVCDKCYGTVINNGSAHWNYCPNCGCRMKGADNE